MALSSNSLIHLTKRKESLIGILKNNFRVKFCTELIRTFGGGFSAVIPMVSFCDIPLSQLKNHIDSYGHYGIGLTKSWGKQNGLNPVLYIDSESTFGKTIKVQSREILKGKANFDELLPAQKILVDIIRYSKNYEGDLKRIDEKVIKNYRFSDEREWRHVPPLEQGNMIEILRNYDTDEKKKEVNNRIKDLRLEFTPDDITYIIIQNDSEISEFINVLRDSKGKKYSYDQVERLVSRLITTDQILKDF